VGKLDLERYLDLALLVDDWLSTDSVLEGELGSRSRFLVRVDGAAAGGSRTGASDAGFRRASCLREGRGLAALLPLPAALPARSARRRVDSLRIFPTEAAKSIRGRCACQLSLIWCSSAQCANFLARGCGCLSTERCAKVVWRCAKQARCG
jgi:hypothetical protein